MKEDSVQLNLMADVPLADHPVMTESFLQIYRQALGFSNLEVDQHLRFRNVAIYDKQHMHEVYTVGSKQLPHLVLLHGYGGTSLTFVRMYQHLRTHFQVHALDTFGVGLSSRGAWHDKMTREQAAEYFIGAVEEWRKSSGLQHFILAGHSFGGYISTLYFEKYPHRVQQLMLLSPAGTAKLTEEDIAERKRNSRVFMCIAQKVYNMKFRPIKVMNNWMFGNWFQNKIFKNRLKLPENQEVVWRQYIKHIAGQEVCSQKGFYDLFDWPLQPARSIQQILRAVRPKIPIDFMYGDQDWMRPAGAHRLANEFQNIKVHQVQEAGHQMLFDNPFNVSSLMKKVLRSIK